MRTGRQDIQTKIFDLLDRAPPSALRELVHYATSWLRERSAILSEAGQVGSARLLAFWDRVADVVYVGEPGDETEERSTNDPSFGSLNEPGGILARILYERLLAGKPKTDSGVPDDLRDRLTRATTASGRAGFLARTFLVRELSNLEFIDSDWTMRYLVPYLLATDTEASLLWISRAAGQVGRPRLFNVLKPGFLAALQDHRSEKKATGLVIHLLQVSFWRQKGDTAYELSSAEARRALAGASADARHHASWQLWRWMAEEGSQTETQGERWSNLIGPVFSNIWPLDANLRDSRTSHDLVNMALEAGDAFPQAVDTIFHQIVPFQVYTIASSFRLEKAHRAATVRYPKAFLRLLNAVLDPAIGPLPNDLASILAECREADPTVVDDPSYIRLFGLRRAQGA